MKSILITLSLALLTTTAFAGGDDDHGDHSAKMHFEHKCAQCHGRTGHSNMDIFPNLAGQKKSYVEQQLKDFRDKKRPGSYMPTITDGMSDQLIQEMALYISSMSSCQ